MPMDPDVRDIIERLERTIMENRDARNELGRQIRAEVAAMESRLNHEINADAARLAKLHEHVVGDGSTGLASRVKVNEISVERISADISSMRDSIRFYYRWFMTTGLLALISLAMQGVKIWTEYHHHTP